MNARRMLGVVSLCLTFFVGSLCGLPRLTAAPEPAGPKVTAARFEFEVIESFDAKYLGDTPGHHGRNGGLVARPRVYLGDPVYRGETVVGHVTSVIWDRVNGGLNVEFDPAPLQLVSVGDVAWIRLDGSPPPVAP